MSATETVPTTREVAEMERDDELESYMRDVYEEIRRTHRERRFHDRDAFLAHGAGEAECLALGHIEPQNGWEDDEAHPPGWGWEPICLATRHGVACSACESEDCEGHDYLAMSTRAEFWALVSEASA